MCRRKRTRRCYHASSIGRKLNLSYHDLTKYFICYWLSWLVYVESKVASSKCSHKDATIIKGTADYRILYTKRKNILVGFYDTNYARDKATRRLITRYSFNLGSKAIF